MRDSYRILRTQLLKVCTSSVALSAYTYTLQPGPYTTTPYTAPVASVADSRGDSSRQGVNSVHSTHGKHSGIEPQTFLTSSSGDLLVTSDDTVYPSPYLNPTPTPTPDAHPTPAPALSEETYTPNTDASVYIQALYESKWLQHLSDILQAAVYVANQLEAGQPCLVHCSGMIYTCIHILLHTCLYKCTLYYNEICCIILTYTYLYTYIHIFICIHIHIYVYRWMGPHQPSVLYRSDNTR